MGTTCDEVLRRLPPKTRLKPVSVLGAPHTVETLRKYIATQRGVEAYEWMAPKWLAWECGGMGELRFWGRPIFTFETTHQGAPRLIRATT